MFCKNSRSLETALITESRNANNDDPFLSKRRKFWSESIITERLFQQLKWLKPFRTWDNVQYCLNYCFSTRKLTKQNRKYLSQSVNPPWKRPRGIDSSPFMPDPGPEVFGTPVWKIHRKLPAGFLLGKRNARIEFGSWYRNVLESFEKNIINLSYRIFSATLCLICHTWTSSNVRIEDVSLEWRKATFLHLHNIALRRKMALQTVVSELLQIWQACAARIYLEPKV